MTKKTRNNEHLDAFVTVNGKQFRHSQTNGLCVEAVLELEGFIRSEASKYLHSYPGCLLDFEDLVQEGRIGALKAAKRFDPSRKVQFITFASFSIRSEMGQAAGSGIIRTPRGKKSVPVTLMDSESLGRLEECDSQSAAEDLEQRVLYEQAIEQVQKLPENKKSLLLRWANGATLSEIAQERGYSRQRASQIFRESCEAVRASIAA